MFKLLGAGVAIYALYAATTGEVFAKAGAGGRFVSRRDSPAYFWAVIAIYTCLAAALLFVF